MIENGHNKLTKKSTRFLLGPGKMQEDEDGENWEDV